MVSGPVAEDPDNIVNHFAAHWAQFDHANVPDEDLRGVFQQYFSVFPWSGITSDAVGFDLGCGTGRWGRFVAPRVGTLHLIEPSDALEAARQNLAEFPNCEFHKAGAGDLPFPGNSMDFGYCLGVAHHLDDPVRALRSAVQALKPNAPLLVYLYYNLENRPWSWRLLWRLSNNVRRLVSQRSYPVKRVVGTLAAVTIYWPLARTARLLARLGLPVSSIPLAFYRDLPFYVMRTDATDRFGTPRELRFSRREVEQMMTDAGLGEIKFSEGAPYWCAVGRKIEK